MSRTQNDPGVILIVARATKRATGLLSAGSSTHTVANRIQEVEFMRRQAGTAKVVLFGRSGGGTSMSYALAPHIGDEGRHGDARGAI